MRGGEHRRVRLELFLGEQCRVGRRKLFVENGGCRGVRHQLVNSLARLAIVIHPLWKTEASNSPADHR
jgi:hypothetical protein